MTKEQTRIQSIFMLALTTWREARGEDYQAKIGVAHSIMNRVKHPGWWGKDVLGVCGKKWQYSSLTAPGDPNLIVWPTTYDVSWQSCLDVAVSVYDGALGDPTNEADSYYDTSISPPDWATPETFTVQLGKIRFHKLAGS